MKKHGNQHSLIIGFTTIYKFYDVAKVGVKHQSIKNHYRLYLLSHCLFYYSYLMNKETQHGNQYSLP